MPSWLSVLVIAIGGGMLIEGALYALFPSGMKKAMSDMQTQPDHVLRVVGLCVAGLGVAIVYLFIPK
ncbi:MAG: DUF2065 domain-containing protein [Robiginitomaculum sp.]|nr:DUF2065 domain-containing protein [Robiginitomaculum sp.]